MRRVEEPRGGDLRQTFGHEGKCDGSNGLHENVVGIEGRWLVEKRPQSEKAASTIGSLSFCFTNNSTFKLVRRALLAEAEPRRGSRTRARGAPNGTLVLRVCELGEL